MKEKAFFIIFKGFSIKQITKIFLEGESPTLKLLWKYVFHNRTFINSSIKWKENYIAIGTFLSNDNTYFNATVLLPWFKTFDSTKNTESTGRWKTSFIKHIVENADLHKPVSNKIMTTQELCEKYDSVAPLQVHSQVWDNF